MRQYGARSGRSHGGGRGGGGQGGGGGGGGGGGQRGGGGGGADSRQPLLLLLRASNESVIEKLFDDCFAHRGERSLPKSKAATLHAELKLERADQPREVYQVLSENLPTHS